MQMNSAASAQDYLRPRTLTEALDSLALGGRRILAGGTDVYPSAGARLQSPVLDIMSLSELCGISSDNGLRIGSTTTWTQIAEAQLPPSLFGLQAAARQIGGRQIQNVGTIGGNLCNCSPAADGAVALLALDAEVELMSATGPRRLSLPQYLLGPRLTALRADEIMTALVIPEAALGGRSHFVKLGARSHLVISIAMVAARVAVVEGRVANVAIAVGACSPVARRLTKVEATLVGCSEQNVGEAVTADDVQQSVSPIDDVRASARYRNEAIVELVRRAVKGALR